jgi:hypothetical protein
MDTLKYFEELRATGVNELEAKAHVYALQSTLAGMATKDDLHNEISGLETRIDAKFGIMTAKIDTLRTLGWALFGAFLLPIIKVAFWP